MTKAVARAAFTNKWVTRRQIFYAFGKVGEQSLHEQGLTSKELRYWSRRAAREGWRSRTAPRQDKPMSATERKLRRMVRRLKTRLA